MFGSSAPVLPLCRKLATGSNVTRKRAIKKKVKVKVMDTERTRCCHNKLRLPRGTQFYRWLCCGLCTQDNNRRDRAGVAAGLSSPL